VTYSTPFATSGYRSDCRRVPFNDILTINHATNQRAWFKQTSRTAFLMANYNYYVGGSNFGLWNGFGVAPQSYQYQIQICDITTDLSPELMVSGYTSCYKQCNDWCGDGSTAYFRMQSPNHGAYLGNAWNENGHGNVGLKLVSYGVRQS
jgi:hypothetical protein